jgi:hypothetical protein
MSGLRGRERHGRRFARAMPLAAWLALAPAVCAADEAATLLHRCVAAVSDQIDPRAVEALNRLDGVGRQLLALRSYLRSSAHLGERWSWTSDQIASFEGSPAQRELQQQIERVQAAFARDNPGYELYVNPQVRSLDVQIDHWNTNPSVAAAATGLLQAVDRPLASDGRPPRKAEKAPGDCGTFLKGYAPEPTPTIAAPGLSPHGQMRAVDFQVQQGSRIVAGTNTATIETDWDAAGWTSRLNAAVREASQQFVGPLSSPREPWHYTYISEAVASK